MVVAFLPIAFLLLAFIDKAGSYSAEPPGSSGEPGCQCIDAFTRSLTIANSAGGCDWRAESALAPCYTQDYGNDGCRQYDLNLNISGCDVKNPAPWCDKAWCWIDPANCTSPNGQSGFFPSSTFTSSDGTTRPLTYSYATCGNLDEYERDKKLRQLQAFGPLRVSFPGNSGSGYTVTDAKVGEAGAGNTRRDGSVLRFFETTMAAHGVDWYEVPRSASSSAFGTIHSSSFTACTHEVALNRSDVCVGNLWPTPFRRRIAAFSNVIYLDAFHAIAFRVQTTRRARAFGDALVAPLQPFSMGLWFAILGTVLLVALVMWIVEGWSNDEDFPQTKIAPSLVIAGFKALRTFPGGAGINFSPKTNVGQLIILVFSFAALVLTAQYTAVVTANIVLSEERVEANVSTFEDALMLHQKICGLEATKPSFAERYPASVELYVGKKNSNAVLIGMDEGECQVGILTEDEWRRARMGDKSRPEDSPIYANSSSPATYHCDTKIALPGAIYFVGNALAVRDELQAPLSWALTRQEDSTPYSGAALAAQQKFLKTPDGNSQPYCDFKGFSSNQTALSERITRIYLEDFYGPIFYTAVVTIVGLLISGLIELYRQEWELKQHTGVEGETKEQHAARVLLSPPTLFGRLTGLGKRSKAAQTVTDTSREHERRMSELSASNGFAREPTGGGLAEESVTAEEDIDVVSTLMYGRDRVHHYMTGASSNYRNTDDSPLKISDVPMLLRMVASAAQGHTPGEGMLKESGLNTKALPKIGKKGPSPGKKGGRQVRASIFQRSATMGRPRSESPKNASVTEHRLTA